MFKLIDSHCHLDFTVFDQQRIEIIQECQKKGIQSILIPGIKADCWQNLIDLCQTQPSLHYALGLHPFFMASYQKHDLSILEQQIQIQRPLAIGEIGLDFYLKTIDQSLQCNLFEAQLALAQKYQLPVVLHVRKAHDQVLQYLRRYQIQGGICHAFNGSIQQAQKYIEMGFLLGFGGTLTYANAPKIKQLAHTIPLASIVLETDAPDMPTASNKGGINSPLYLLEIAQALAEIRKTTLQQIAQQTTKNMTLLFQIPF